MNESTTLRGKKTCEAPEIAAEISLQVHRKSKELPVSKAADVPYEREARANAQRRSEVKAMSETVWGSPTDRRILLSTGDG